MGFEPEKREYYFYGPASTNEKTTFMEVLDKFQEKFTGSSWGQCSVGGKFGVSCLFLITAAVAFGGTAWFFKEDVTVYNIVQSTTQGANSYSGVPSTGGPDFTAIEAGFSYPDTNYFCDGNIWKLSPGTDQTVVYSGSDLSLTETFQFDFIPTGTEAVNLAFGRPGLFEVVVGDNSYKHVTLKNLQTQEFINLEDSVGNTALRSELKNNISTTSSNFLRLEGRYVSNTYLELVVNINGEVFKSEEIFALDHSKHKSIYLALLRGNNIGVLFPELMVCS